MPTSPQHADNDERDNRAPKFSGKSPREIQAGSYFGNILKVNNAGTGLAAIPPSEFFTSTRQVTTSASTEVLHGRSSHSRTLSSGQDQYALLGGQLPVDKALIRVIYDSGSSSIFSVDTCKNAEEVIAKALQKGKLNEAQIKNHCFYVLMGVEADSNQCRKLADHEVVRICGDKSRVERERLMLRKIHAGEPDGDQLQAAANIAVQQMQQSQSVAASVNPPRSRDKLQKVTGEALPPLTYPMSPASAAERERHLHSAAQDLERGSDTQLPTSRPRPRKLEEPLGDRPESEFVVTNLVEYFPDVNTADIEKTVHDSIRRSQRLSRATNRLSIASSFGVNSRTHDLAMADTWSKGANQPQRIRPLSIARFNIPSVSYRDSMASALEPLEESPIESNRHSYVSFGADSGPDSASVSVNDLDSQTLHRSYSDEASSISPSYIESVGSFNEQLSQAIAEDGEEPDTELTEFLNTDSWENVKYLRGRLIGQGSFGSVYLALHTMTGELMAVKQVELPNSASTINNAALEAKKNTMVEALKREISLLKDLKHKNIVQYFGSSTESSTLNIFLEYIPGGSIAKMLVDYGSLTEGLVASFVQQTLVGLAYLHSKDIIHRDIKGANVLVDNHGIVKISDFGISKRVQDSKSLLVSNSTGSASGVRRGAAGLLGTNNRVSLQGSVFWMAPEVVRQTAYTRKADIWSLGCLIVEMLTGTHPHPTCSQLQAIFKIGGKGMSGTDPAPEIPAGASPELVEFLQSTFAIDFEQRPEASELLGMPFFRGIVPP